MIMFFALEDNSVRRSVNWSRNVGLLSFTWQLDVGVIDACYSIGWLQFELYVPCFVFKAGIVVSMQSCNCCFIFCDKCNSPSSLVNSVDGLYLICICIEFR